MKKGSESRIGLVAKGVHETGLEVTKSHLSSCAYLGHEKGFIKGEGQKAKVWAVICDEKFLRAFG